VDSSYKERVVLGPEERAMIRTLNSTYSVIEVWRRLIAAADFNVLRPERRALRRQDEPEKASRLVLKWEQEGEKREGPAYTIVKVCKAPKKTTTGSLPSPFCAQKHRIPCMPTKDTCSTPPLFLSHASTIRARCTNE
jgi:hypothetical protein